MARGKFFAEVAQQFSGPSTRFEGGGHDIVAARCPIGRRSLADALQRFDCRPRRLLWTFDTGLADRYHLAFMCTRAARLNGDLGAVVRSERMNFPTCGVASVAGV